MNPSVRTDEKKAVALKYVRDLPAPFIVAKGRAQLADRLLRIAEEHGVSIMQREQLAETLFEFDIGTFIPEELYEIIAQLLAYIYTLRASK